MRSTTDLIEELDAEAREHWQVFLVVGFEDTSIFIDPVDANRLALLNDAIEQGGTPTGLIAFDHPQSGVLEAMARVYPEHGESPEISTFMESLLETTRKSMMQRYGIGEEGCA